VTDDLKALRAEFPAYLIWRETARGETRYVAQRQRQTLGPHTVITADAGELRGALVPALPVRVRPAVAAGRDAG